MLGVLERGNIKTECKVLPTPVGFKGKLSIPGWGTKYTAPDKDDAIAALVDLRAEAFPSLKEELRETAAPLEK